MPELKVLLIYEILGRPPEHIKQALEKFTEDFKEKKGVKLLSKKVHEPKPLEKTKERPDTEGLFTTFAEVELELENLNLLFNIVLNTLPANIEILSPSSLSMNNFDISQILSELTIKLHKFDEVAKVLAIEKSNLINELNHLKQSQPQLNINTNIKPEDKKSENKEDKTEEEKSEEEKPENKIEIKKETSKDNELNE
jgi:hypothetical protein